MTGYQRQVTYNKKLLNFIFVFVYLRVCPSFKPISCSDFVSVYPSPEGGGRDSVLCHFCDPNGPLPPALRGCGLALRQRRRPPPLRSGGRGLFVYCYPVVQPMGLYFLFLILRLMCNLVSKALWTACPGSLELIKSISGRNRLCQMYHLLGVRSIR